MSKIRNQQLMAVTGIVVFALSLLLTLTGCEQKGEEPSGSPAAVSPPKVEAPGGPGERERELLAIQQRGGSLTERESAELVCLQTNRKIRVLRQLRPGQAALQNDCTR